MRRGEGGEEREAEAASPEEGERGGGLERRQEISLPQQKQGGRSGQSLSLKDRVPR